MDDVTEFPAQFARTRRFALGVPRRFTVAADGSRVFFVRSASGSDPTSSLWVWEDGHERVLADPRLLIGVGDEVPAAERLRRERARESSQGVVSYSVDRWGRVAAFALSGALWAVRVGDGAPFPVSAAGPVVDPRLSPDGRWIGYVTAGALHIVELPATGSAPGREAATAAGPTDAQQPAPARAASPVANTQLTPWGAQSATATAGPTPTGAQPTPADGQPTPADTQSRAADTHPTAAGAANPGPGGVDGAAGPVRSGAPAGGAAEGGRDADRLLLAPEGAEVSYGLAEYVAAESMGRNRGFWWAPDSRSLLVARVDVTPVRRLFIGDATHPHQKPRAIRYPSAGTPNADVSLHLVTLDGRRTEVRWDRTAFEYLVTAGWETIAPNPRADTPQADTPQAGHPADTTPGGQPPAATPAGAASRPGVPIITVQSRDQRTMQVLRVDPDTGATHPLHERRDAAWVEIVPGIPASTPTGTRVWPRETAGTRGLRIVPGRSDEDGGGQGATGGRGEEAGSGPAIETPEGLQVEAVLGIDGEQVLFAASEEPTERHVWSYAPGDGLRQLSQGPGVHDAVCGGGTVVLDSQTPDGHTVTVVRDGLPIGRIGSHAERPVVTPRPTQLRLGERALRSALYLPSWHTAAHGKLPVLLDPYGGPALRLVRRCRGWWTCVSQWFAEQGFAVLVTDGRGTPGRGPAWEKSVHGDPLTPVLDDQVDALYAAAAANPSLDVDRVAIRGWSFGGYLAAGAVLHRPEVFHAAIAGAAPTDQRLYDTHWKERFLGHPDEEPAAYDAASLVGHGHLLRRPLLLVHGLADDNVLAAHTLRFSAELLSSGRPHTVLPLPGATHLPLDNAVTENLLRFQVDFLRRSLGGAHA